MNTPLEVFNSIAQELSEYPERWCQGGLSFTKDGLIPVPSRDEHAVKWCIVGHINKHLDNIFGPLHRKCYNLIQDKIESVNIPKWNDAKGRTVEDVINLCKSVA